jgi:phosphonate utilization transcriptional regulator
MEDEIRSTLQLLRSESLTSIAYKAIEHMILNGELDPGAHLNENALATKLSISRGPVREALRALEQSGLVRVIANRGVFVREFSLEEAVHAYDIRASLFGLAGKILAGTLTREQIGRLSDLVEEMETAKTKSDVSAYYSLNVDFHSSLVALCGNEELASIYRRLVKKLHLFRRRALLLGGGLKVSNQEHRAILRAIAAGDASRARRVMEDHILAGKRRFLFALREMSAKPIQRRGTGED